MKPKTWQQLGNVCLLALKVLINLHYNIFSLISAAAVVDVDYDPLCFLIQLTIPMFMRFKDKVFDENIDSDFMAF